MLLWSEICCNCALFFQQKLGDGLLSGRNKFHSLQGAGCLRLTCSVFPELCVNLVVGVSMNRCAVRCFHWWIIRGKKYLLELLESAGIIHLVSLEVAHLAKLILDYVQKYFGSTLHGIQIYLHGIQIYLCFGLRASQN